MNDNTKPAALTTRTLVDFLGDPEANEPWPVVIVGSGYGGSVAAHVLAQATGPERDPTTRVLLLERGKAWTAGDFPRTFGELPRDLRMSSKGKVGNPEGLFDLRMGKDVVALVANGVGGGSLINAGVMIDPEPASVDSPFLAKRIKDLIENKTYRRARRILGGEVFREGRWVSNNAQRWQKALRKFDAFESIVKTRNTKDPKDQPADFKPVDITVGMDCGNNYANIQLEACNGCGDCMTGCNVGAKDSLDRNLLLKAQRTPGFKLEVVTGATVSSLRRDDQGMWVIRLNHTDDRLQMRQNEPIRIRAKRVVLAAGALGSPEILLRSRTDKLVFSPALGESFSGNGDDIAAIHRLAEPVYSAADEDLPLPHRQVGPTTTACAGLKPANGKPFLVEEFSVPGPMRRLFDETVTTGHAIAQLPKGDCSKHGPGDLDPLAVDPQAMDRTLLVGVIGHDDARGCLRLWQPDRVRREVPPMGTINIHWPDARWGRELDAAHDRLKSFVEDLPHKVPQVEPPSLVANPMWRLLPEGLESLVSQPRGPVLTVHPLGGCRMGERSPAEVSRSGVVDELGRVFNHGDEALDPWFGSLVVLDGSIIGASLGVNPALTITALSLAAMDGLLMQDNWSELGQPTGDPDTLTSTLPDKAEHALVATWDAPPSAKPPERKTELVIVERMWGEVNLADHPRMAVELTMRYNPAAVATLAGPNRETPVGIDTEYSSFRLFTIPDEQRLDLRQVEESERLRYLQFEARFEKGQLRFLHRNESSPLPRTVRALYAWVRNRGARDWWQQCVVPVLTRAGRAQRNADKASQPPRPRKALGSQVTSRLMEFVNLASRAGQVRLFDYELTVGSVMQDNGNFKRLFTPGALIKGEKRLTYGRRANPWRQLTQMSLHTMPGLKKEQDGTNPVLKLDLRHLASNGLPLITISRQRNHAEALAELVGLGLYLLRVLLHTHIWSFRKPDLNAAPREVDRLPRELPGLPAPQITTLIVDKWPEGSSLEGQPVTIRLTRYPLAQRATGGKPLVMIHGYSASGTTFAHPSLELSAVAHFWKQGRDVWVLDLRTSCGLDSAQYEWAMEQPALIDIPAALLHVRNSTGQRVDVLAHCIGGAMLSMAMLSDAASVRSGRLDLGVKTWLTSEHLGTLEAFHGNVLAPDAPHATVNSIVLSQKGPVMRYTDDNVFRAFVLQYARRFLMGDGYSFRRSRNPGVAEELTDRLLASLPYDKADFDRENPIWPWATTPWTATRHRLDALFGRVFSAANLSDGTLAAIDDFFGPINLDTVTQAIHFARWDAITNQRGRGEFLTRERIATRWRKTPTLALHAPENGMVHPYTLDLLVGTLGDAGVPLATRLLSKGTGHQDSLIGHGAAEVFGHIDSFLEGRMKPDPPASNVPPPWIAAQPWLGPRLVLPEPLQHPHARVAVMSSPAEGDGALWLVPAWRINTGCSFRYWLLAPGETPWVSGQEQDNRNWLNATPDVTTLSAPPSCASGEFGWLAVVVHDIKQTSARLDRRPPKPMAGLSGGGANGAAASQTTDLPVYGLRQPGMELSHKVELSMLPPAIKAALKASAAALAHNWSVQFPSQANPSPEQQTAVWNWFRNAHATVIDKCFVRADDVRRLSPKVLPSGAMRFALASCQYPHGLFDRDVAGDSLKRMALGEEAPSFALMVGDQIYADATAGLADPTRADETYDLPHQRAFRLAEMRSVMQRMPVQMLLDDHELVDNWQTPAPFPRDLSKDELRFPEDPRGPRRHHHDERLRKALNGGRLSFLRYQRMQSSVPGGGLDQTFEAGGHAFYLLDTRTQRVRGQPSTGPTCGHIINEVQRQAFEHWLDTHQHQVKFVATPSLFLPRRREAARSLRNACALDAWNGFPASIAWLLKLVLEKQVRKLVLLSGDEHHALFSEVWVGPDRIKLVNVHSSALYAPYTFANGRPRDLMEEEQSADYGTAFEVKTEFVPIGDGFALLDVGGDAQMPFLRIEFIKAHETGSVSYRVPLL